MLSSRLCRISRTEENPTRTPGTFTSNLPFQTNPEVCRPHTLALAHSDDANDAHCIFRITRPLKTPAKNHFQTGFQKHYFWHLWHLKHHPNSSPRPLFCRHPLITHFVRQTQLSWRLLRRLAFVTLSILYITINLPPPQKKKVYLPSSK